MSSEHDEGREVGDGFCSECYGLGHSRIVKRDVKGFREIYVRAFECEDCSRKTEEVQLAGQCDPQGVRLRLSVPAGDAAALARRVLKSDTASVSIPELEFEIGTGSYVPFTGDLTTISAVLLRACKNLNMNQSERRAADAETAGKIDTFIMELEEYAEGKHAFTFEVEDKAGNSYIEGPAGSAANGACEGGDPLLSVERFDRTPAQESRMGLAMPDEFLPDEEGGAAAAGGGGGQPPASAPGRLILRVEGQADVASFMAAYAEPAELSVDAVLAAPAGIELPRVCGVCGAAGSAGFAAALHRPAAGVGLVGGCLVARASCGACSATSAEVRSTGGVPAQGTRLRLRVEGPADLERAVLQSASASLAVPEVELALSTGSEGGVATTVGQLISLLATQLAGKPALAPGGGGDAAEEATDWADFGASLRAFAAVERPWTLELTDPLACSLIGPKPADAAASRTEDPQVQVVRYERAPDENAHFGLAAGGGAAPIA